MPGHKFKSRTTALSKHLKLRVTPWQSLPPDVEIKFPERLPDGSVGRRWNFYTVDINCLGQMKEEIDLAWEHYQRVLSEKE